MLRVVCWNVAWCRPRSDRGRAIREILLRDNPDIVCCPEAYTDFLPDDWHRAESQADYGYPIIEGRRKVILWSRHPWQFIDSVGAPNLPPGRFVSGVTIAEGRQMRVIGVCVPWRAAHVTTGRKDRRPWEEHQAYLAGLEDVLRSLEADMPTILVGDINQHIPRGIAPRPLHEKLMTALAGYTVHTSGWVPPLEKRPVCHIASTNHFAFGEVTGQTRWLEGRALSDHDAVAARLSLR